MRRVVVTGHGDRLLDRQQHARSAGEPARGALRHHAAPKSYAELGFRSQVHGAPTLKPEEIVDRRAMRFHGGGTAWNHVAMDQAIRDSGLEPDEVSNERTGHHHGLGRPFDARDRRGRRRHPHQGAQAGRPLRACRSRCARPPRRRLSTWFKIKGVSYSISSACATSNHCIGAAYEQILIGKQDVMFAGGCEELDWTLSVLFDAMGAMSSRYNETPERASRAYDKNRDGFVISGGAGVLVLEDYERAKARGAQIYGEIVGYGATSDGADMVAPSGEGAARCMRQALATVEGPDRLHQPARDLDAGRRSQGDRGDCARCSARATNARRSRRRNR